jgi:hypothetical protein
MRKSNFEGRQWQFRTFLRSAPLQLITEMQICSCRETFFFLWTAVDMQLEQYFLYIVADLQTTKKIVIADLQKHHFLIKLRISGYDSPFFKLRGIATGAHL